VAGEFAGAFVQCEAYIAVLATGHPSAGATFEQGSISSAVLEEYYLFFLF
jgi:hypothetical protein